MKVKAINVTPTKNIILLLNSNGIPLLFPNLYLVTYKNALSEKRLQYIVTVLKRATEFFTSKDISFEELLLNGDFDIVFKFIHSFYEEYLEQYKLSEEAYNIHVYFLRDYVLWSIQRYLHRVHRSSFISILKLNIVKCEDLFNSFLIRNKKHPTSFKVIEKNHIDYIISELYNKKENGAINFRNYLVVKLLYETGIRLGELLNLKTTDIIFEDSKTYFKIIENNSDDTRKDKPRIKNVQSNRVIALSSSNSELIEHYIVKIRRKNYSVIGTKIKHSFLFCSKLGKPLSKSNIQLLFQQINRECCTSYYLVPQRITPHTLRHTFAYNFLKFLIEEKELDLERAKDELRNTCGWKPSSNMPQLYAGKYIWESANKHNIERINSLYEQKV